MSKQQADSAAAQELLVDGEVPRRSTSFARFVLDVALIGGLLGAGMYFYRSYVTTKEQKGRLIVEARDKAKRNDLTSLTEAEGLYRKVLELDGDDVRALSALAELKFWQSQHGLETAADAEQYTVEAESLGAERPDLYAAKAFLLIMKGQATQAENDIRALLERDLASPKLAHALAWALLEQGKFTESNRIVRQAQEADFSNVALRLMLAESAHRQGQERVAVGHLRGIIKESMNPNHASARAWLAALLAKNYGNIAEPAEHIQALHERVREAQDDPAKAVGPRGEALLAWAEAELALAMGNAERTIEKADLALSKWPKHPPFLETKARALVAMKKGKSALELHEEAAAATPHYVGIKWGLAELKSHRRDEGALAIIDEIEKAHVGPRGPEFEVFRGEHYLRMGNVEEAKAAFTRAAELGDDATILFGLARVTFEEEKKRGDKADLEKVAQAFQLTVDKRSTYPEAHQYMAEISLWNYVLDGADGSLSTAEQQYKKLNRPIPELVRFYDAAAQTFRRAKLPKKYKGQAMKYAAAWNERKKNYMGTILTQ